MAEKTAREVYESFTPNQKRDMQYILGAIIELKRELTKEQEALFGGFLISLV